MEVGISSVPRDRFHCTHTIEAVSPTPTDWFVLSLDAAVMEVHCIRGRLRESNDHLEGRVLGAVRDGGLFPVCSSVFRPMSADL